MWADWVKPEKAICPEGYGCKEVKPKEPTISELFAELLECCNFDCNQGRDCVKRKRRSD